MRARGGTRVDGRRDPACHLPNVDYCVSGYMVHVRIVSVSGDLKEERWRDNNKKKVIIIQ